MALVSRVFDNWWDEVDRTHREIDEHLRQLSRRRDNLWVPPPPIRSIHDRFRPWRTIFDNLNYQVGGAATVERDEDKYQVIVDVQQFTPQEIIVRTDDRCITVEAKHEERRDNHGYVSRQFVRRYVLPKGYDIGHVRPSLSSDGILTVTVPRLALPAPGERIVPIQRTYRPAIKAA